MTEAYGALEAAHVALVLLSGAGFALRGAWMLRGSPLLERRVVRVLPHVIDTGLLLSGASLAVIARLWPPDHPWLAAKLLLLVAYVAAGTVALRRGRTRRIRAAAFAAALFLYALILISALTHRALGIF